MQNIGYKTEFRHKTHKLNSDVYEESRNEISSVNLFESIWDLMTNFDSDYRTIHRGVRLNQFYAKYKI